MNNEQTGIRGHIRVWITDIYGVKRLTQDFDNAIRAAYAEIIVEALKAAVDYGLNAPFVASTNPPTEDKDGIIIKENAGGLWYGMIMGANVRSAGAIKFTGTFLNAGALLTFANAADVLLGHKYENAAPTDFTSVGDAYSYFANAGGWASQAVATGETLTIEWTITHY